MHNSVYLIGRLTSEPEVKTTEDGKSRLYLTLAVQRDYKNTEGKYDVDFIDCVLWNGVAEHTSEYCKKGDLVGIKGRLQTRTYKENGDKKSSMDVAVDRVSFLAAKKEPEQDAER